MTTPLQPQEIAMFQHLKKTAIVLILLLRLDRPLSAAEVAETLDINLETARGYLKQLDEDGLVIRQGRYGGYVLTSGGRQMVMPMDAPTLDPGEIFGAQTNNGNAEIPRTSAENPRSELAENAQNYADFKQSENSPESGGNAENPRTNAENPRTNAENPRTNAENPRSRRAKRSLNNNNYIDSLNQDVVVRGGRTSGAGQGSTRKGKRALLVGEGVEPRICDELAARREVTKAHITGWAATLKARWGEKYSPGNLVSALRRVRQGDPAPVVPDPEPVIPAEVPEPEPMPAPVAVPPAQIVGWDGQGMEPDAAWQAAGMLIERDNRAVYRQWLVPTRLVRVENERYTVACPSADHAAWLTERLTTTLNNMITGYRNAPAQVVFVAE